MSTTYDIAIVGAGLAGVCAALHLSSRERILLLEAGDAPRGASAIAAGLVNPFMGRKGRPVWRYREALDALTDTLARAQASDHFDRSGVFRPASDEEQADYFLHLAETSAGCRFVSGSDAAVRWPDVRAPLGGLLVSIGGAVDTPSFLNAGIAAVLRGGGEYRSTCPILSVKQLQDRVDIGVDGGETLYASRIIVAAGAGLRRIDGIPPLNVHHVKGQTITIDRTDTPYASSEIPHLAGRGYLVSGRSRFTIGSSYQHDFADLAPSTTASEEILDRARTNLPLLVLNDTMREAAGIRVNVPGTRLPMVGPLPGANRIWVFTGLGSKGLLMAPLIARDLPSYLDDPARIPVQTRVAELPAV